MLPGKNDHVGIGRQRPRQEVDRVRSVSGDDHLVIGPRPNESGDALPGTFVCSRRNPRLETGSSVNAAVPGQKCLHRRVHDLERGRACGEVEVYVGGATRRQHRHRHARTAQLQCAVALPAGGKSDATALAWHRCHVIRILHLGWNAEPRHGVCICVNEVQNGRTVIAVLEQRPTDELVAREAGRLAKRSGGQVILLGALPLVELSIRAESDGGRIEPWEQMRTHKALERRRLTELGRTLEVPVDVAIQFGDPLDSVALEAAKRGTMLVVVASADGSRFGRRRLERELVRSLNVPVALVSARIRHISAN